MRLLVLALACLAAVAYAGDVCQPATNVESKQGLINNLLTYINKPVNPSPPVPQVDSSKLKGIGLLPKRKVFSVFDERVWPETERILEKFLTAPTFEDFIKVAETIYPRVNEDLFLYCLSVAILHRPDATGVHVPKVHMVYPDKFIHRDVIMRLKNKVMAGQKNVIINGTLTHNNYLDPYRRVEYFTEDIGMNSHHYHWHVLHPIVWSSKLGNPKDRPGEFFYWLHRQMVARFDSELLSEDIPRIEPFDNWNEPIMIGYAPHLTVQRTGYEYMFRPEGLVLDNLPELTKDEMYQWRMRILEGVHRGRLTLDNNTKHELHGEDHHDNDEDEIHAIDTLASVVVSSRTSLNKEYYGNLHNYAHVIASKIADSHGQHMEDYGVMYDATTSARDPLFYSWHKFVDSIFTEYQHTLEPYTHYELTWPDVSLEELYVLDDEENEVNNLRTFYDTIPMKLYKGFDFTRDTEPTLLIKHLDHDDFTYHIKAKNHAKTPKKAVIRIYLAPKYDEHYHAFEPNEQRLLVIELDKFSTTLKPGVNNLERHSNESTVIMNKNFIYGDGRLAKIHDHDHCWCGWPENLLIPKGTYEGMSFYLFVMATDYESEVIPDALNNPCLCKDAHSYCGTIFGKYPGKRPLGFPFDREISEHGWEEFETQNMISEEITIHFTGEGEHHRH